MQVFHSSFFVSYCFAVTISTPAIFSESIKQIAKVARANQNGQKYYVLLIITRGIINGMNAHIID
jgi:hypothetical protein